MRFFKRLKAIEDIISGVPTDADIFFRRRPKGLLHKYEELEKRLQSLQQDHEKQKALLAELIDYVYKEDIDN